VSRCLGRLKECQPVDEANEGGFDSITEVIERSIASEIPSSCDSCRMSMLFGGSIRFSTSNFSPVKALLQGG